MYPSYLLNISGRKKPGFLCRHCGGHRNSEKPGFYPRLLRRYYPSVKNVTAGSNYELAVEFDNGESGILDMKPFLDIGVFKKLREPSVFKQVRVSFDTIEWDSGVDLDPEFVYSKCHSKRTAQQAVAP